MKNRIRAVLLCGLPCSFALMLAEAALYTAVEIPVQALPVLAAFALLTGCCAAGYRAGKTGRSGGLRSGLLCAALLSGMWYAAAFLITERVCVPMSLPVMLAGGASGGVLGVNARPPRIRRRSKRLRHLRERLRLFHPFRMLRCRLHKGGEK